MAAGVGGSVYLFQVLRNTEKQRVVNDLESSCDLKALELETSMLGGITIMYAMRDIVSLHPNITNIEWNAYTSNLVEQGKARLLSLSRVAVVEQKDIHGWESGTGVEMRQLNAVGQLERAVLNRSLYVPIVNIYPKKANILGFDNYNDPTRRAVIDQGKSSHGLSLSDAFFAPNAINAMGKLEKAFLVFLPLFTNNGKWLGGFTEAFFETTILKDRSGSDKKFAFLTGKSRLFSDIPDNDCNPRTQRQFVLADRVLTLQCYVNFQLTSSPILVVALGTIVSVLIPLVFLLLVSRVLSRQSRTMDREFWKLKTCLLNNVSHELKTPLNAIAGMLDSLLMSRPLQPEQKDCITTAHRASRHLSVMIEDLIDYSSVEAGEFALRPETFKWKENRQTIDSFVASLVTDVPQLIINDEISSETMLTADRRCLERISTVLISNAFKFTPSDGAIIINTNISVEGELKIRVQDSGIGIQREFLPHIGTIFQQGGDISTTRQFGGLGLGLTLVKRFLCLMGGKLQVISKTGAGSVFIVLCPVRPIKLAANKQGTEAAEAVDIKVEPSVAKSQEKILIVDDNSINVKVLTKMLHDRDVIIANDGRQALDQMKEYGHDIAVVLMDISMPVMDGYEATRAMRKAGYTVPVFAVTANTSNDTMWSEAGMNEFIQKPVNKSHLSALFRKYSVPPLE